VCCSLRRICATIGCGQPDVRVYVAGDLASSSKPALLHIHGGGFVVSRAKHHYAQFRKWQ